MSITTAHIDAFAGAVLTPADAGYDAARTVFNGAIDRRPAYIAQATDAHDVAAALRFAQDAGLPVAVRSGGHSGAGYGVIDDGVVIDVRALKRIEIDLARSTVRAGAGLTWGELDAATQAHGLAVTGGRMSTTGIAGLTLGSGSGWLERLHGLTADSLLGATVVTADGDVVRADAHQHPDLFWALRGGGGNFGVVTEFEFALHAVGPLILGGMLLFAYERAAEVLAAYREIMATAPDELGGCAQLFRAPPAPFVPAELVGAPVVAIIVAAFAEIGPAADALVAPLRALGPMIDVVAPMPYVALQQMIDEGCPHGMQNHWRAAFLDDLPDSAIASAVELCAAIPSPLTVVLLQPLGGAYARVEEGTTALGHRGARWAYHALSLWPDPADTELNRAWTLRLADAMAPYGHGAAHPNYVSDDAGDRVRGFYGDATYERLVAVKDRWDPRNVFAANQNIRPSGAA
ncbi:MAG TPA: FAD-binding oxidoreductase [Solirubrobacteraceae bacterium]|jgi:FAD/FMN-containing dehydrogenase|nr:FAD-binding oxidoreductase [Solirubrobacteraceae bacterium]